MSEFPPSSSTQPHESCRVKICGVTQREQALAIAALGADFIGLNFWPQSKRHIHPDEAVKWSRDIPRDTKLVGVFVNPTPSFVIETAASVGLSFVQLHGDESPEFCVELAGQGLKIIKAIQVKDASSLASIAAYPVKDILLDAYHPGQRGGIGQTFPWKLAQDFKIRYPDRSLWLAGGLTPENVTGAVQGVRPSVVDVAGGVEDGTPGVKTLEKVKHFIEAARAGALIL